MLNSLKLKAAGITVCLFRHHIQIRYRQ